MGKRLLHLPMLYHVYLYKTRRRVSQWWRGLKHSCFIYGALGYCVKYFIHSKRSVQPPPLDGFSVSYLPDLLPGFSVVHLPVNVCSRFVVCGVFFFRVNTRFSPLAARGRIITGRSQRKNVALWWFSLSRPGDEKQVWQFLRSHVTVWPPHPARLSGSGSPRHLTFRGGEKKHLAVFKQTDSDEEAGIVCISWHLYRSEIYRLEVMCEIQRLPVMHPPIWWRPTWWMNKVKNRER